MRKGIALCNGIGSRRNLPCNHGSSDIHAGRRNPDFWHSKRYKTALEAGIGGGEVSYQLIALRGDATNQTNFINSLNTLGFAVIRTPATCQRSGAAACLTYPPHTGLAAKLNLPTSCWTGCDSAITINPAVNTSYDMQFDLGTT